MAPSPISYYNGSMEENFLLFFIVLLVSVVFSSFFQRLHIPWVVALILGGMLIGPHAAGVLEVNSTLSFIGQLGLVFLMFMAGLETRISAFAESWKPIGIIAIVNGGIPFLTGMGIGLLFGFDLIVSLLLGIVFISSSIAIIIPALEAHGLIQRQIGKTIVGSVILVDIASLVMLSMLLQSVHATSPLPLPLTYLFLLAFVAALRWIIPRVHWLFQWTAKGEGYLFRQELHAVFLILIGIVLLFEVLGLHPIIAGFFAGLVLSDIIWSDRLLEKIRTISYGIFIPVFFVIVGAETNLPLLVEAGALPLFVLVALAGAVASKFLSGWLAGKISGFSDLESKLIGGASIPRLSTALAVVYTAMALGLLEEGVVAVMVVLSIVTTFVGSWIMQNTSAALTAPVQSENSSPPART